MNDKLTMLDATSYADKLPSSLNQLLKSFTGGECVMVRKMKDADALKGKSGNCHLNVKACIDKQGGSSVNGWLLMRNSMLIEKGLYVWSFHSVWKKPDNKLLDVTEDKNYIGRDKTIFIPDANRVYNLTEGLSHNNFMAFTEQAFAEYYGNSINKQLMINTAYWCNNTMMQLVGVNEHSGVYRLISSDYPDNYKKMCDEYEIDLLNGKPVPRTGSKYDGTGSIPAKIMFDYSLSSM